MKWLQLTVPISPQIEDGCVNLVQELGATAVFTDCLPDSSRLWLHGVFPFETNQKRIKQAMNTYLSSLQDLGFEIPESKLNLRQIDEKEYLYQWKKYFQPLHFANTLLVEPVWSSDQAHAGEKVLKIDPGMAFGTGQHFTTRFCLQWICEHKDHLNSLVDIGCGSGILSMAASLLGVKRVLALDHDSSLMPAIQKNMKLNQVYFPLLTADVSSVPLRGNFEAVVANLHTSILLKAKESLESLLTNGGSLVLTGIGYNRRQEVLDCYSDFSLQKIQEDPQKEWLGIWYTK